MPLQDLESVLTIYDQMIPLQNTILYAPDSYPNRFWNTERNTTEWAVFMTELVLSGNKLAELMLRALAPTLKGAHIGKHTFAQKF